MTTIVAPTHMCEAFEGLKTLIETAQSNAVPSTPAAASAWINEAPNDNARYARKTLAFGTLYSSGPVKLSSFLNKKF